jgi:hypothetical protein
MLGSMILMAALIGQTASSGPDQGPVLSDTARKAQARALAEFRANEHTIESRLEANYQLENQRLREKTGTVNTATDRVITFAAGTGGEYAGYLLRSGGTGAFASVPPTGGSSSTPGARKEPSVSDLKAENFLLKCRLKDSRYLYREANRLYGNEYPLRYQIALRGVR